MSASGALLPRSLRVDFALCSVLCFEGVGFAPPWRPLSAASSRLIVRVIRERKPVIGVLLSLNRKLSMIRKRLLPLGLAITFVAAQPVLAANPDEPGKHDTAKGAAAGAVVGHEVGHGHAAAGAAAGALIGHHEKKKIQKQHSEEKQQ